MALTATLLPRLISSASPPLIYSRISHCGCSFSPSPSSPPPYRLKSNLPTLIPLARAKSGLREMPETESEGIDCVGTGMSAECRASEDSAELGESKPPESLSIEIGGELVQHWNVRILDWAVLISPFFFWGTAMVAMKEVIPKAGPFFVSTFRLIPAGFLLIGFAGITGRKQPVGILAWVSILAFAVVDAACFQGFLAMGLQKTSAGLGSVIIDSQPLTVAILAALIYGESIGLIGAAGLALGVVGLLLLEIPAFQENGATIWGSGEWWMFLAAQSMAIGTVMVRWVSKYSDPVMATGWHMVIGGLPLIAFSILNHDPAMSGDIMNLSSKDYAALIYTSVFGSAVSYGVFFYNATRGSLTKLSSLTFLTPMFASLFGFIYLGETFTPLQLGGALVTIIGIYLVNYKVDQKT